MTIPHLPHNPPITISGVVPHWYNLRDYDSILACYHGTGLSKSDLYSLQRFFRDIDNLTRTSTPQRERAKSLIDELLAEVEDDF